MSSLAIVAISLSEGPESAHRRWSDGRDCWAHRGGQEHHCQSADAFLRYSEGAILDRWLRHAGRDAELAASARSASCRKNHFCSPARSRDNIRYGRLDATDEEVGEAARVVGAHDLIIASASDGYHTR